MLLRTHIYEIKTKVGLSLIIFTLPIDSRLSIIVMIAKSAIL